MAINKFVYNGVVKIDLTEDTVDTNNLLSGYTAHKKDGTQITGQVAFATYYTGSSAPSSSLGVNGDIYLQE